MSLDVLSLAGRVALVTGAARGIGAATALALAEAGARVALVDRDGEGLERTADAIGRAGSDALAIPADVTDAPPWRAPSMPSSRNGDASTGSAATPASSATPPRARCRTTTGPATPTSTCPAPITGRRPPR